VTGVRHAQLAIQNLKKGGHGRIRAREGGAWRTEDNSSRGKTNQLPTEADESKIRAWTATEDRGKTSTLFRGKSLLRGQGGPGNGTLGNDRSPYDTPTTGSI